MRALMSCRFSFILLHLLNFLAGVGDAFSDVMGDCAGDNSGDVLGKVVRDVVGVDDLVVGGLLCSATISALIVSIIRSCFA
jgi:hypothetical protein